MPDDINKSGRRKTDRGVPLSPGHPIPKGARIRGILMLFPLKFQELGDLLNGSAYRQLTLTLQDEILNHFYRPEWDLLVERTDAAGNIYPGPDGRAVVPGHVLEDMWFQIHIAKASGRTELIAPAIEIIPRHLEFGWDEEFGGLLLARDAKGESPI